MTLKISSTIMEERTKNSLCDTGILMKRKNSRILLGPAERSSWALVMLHPSHCQETTVPASWYVQISDIVGHHLDAHHLCPEISYTSCKPYFYEKLRHSMIEERSSRQRGYPCIVSLPLYSDRTCPPSRYYTWMIAGLCRKHHCVCVSCSLRECSNVSGSESRGCKIAS